MNKHGSGAAIIDGEGRFRPQQFEDFFARFDRDGKGGLTKWELWTGVRRSRMAFDFFGQVSAMFECKLFYRGEGPRADGVQGALPGYFFGPRMVFCGKRR